MGGRIIYLILLMIFQVKHHDVYFQTNLNSARSLHRHQHLLSMTCLVIVFQFLSYKLDGVTIS